MKIALQSGVAGPTVRKLPPSDCNPLQLCERGHFAGHGSAIPALIIQEHRDSDPSIRRSHANTSSRIRTRQPPFRFDPPGFFVHDGFNCRIDTEIPFFKVGSINLRFEECDPGENNPEHTRQHDGRHAPTRRPLRTFKQHPSNEIRSVGRNAIPAPKFVFEDQYAIEIGNDGPQPRRPHQWGGHLPAGCDPRERHCHRIREPRISDRHTADTRERAFRRNGTTAPDAAPRQADVEQSFETEYSRGDHAAS